MRLQYHHKGKKFRKTGWPVDEWVVILDFCQNWIVAKDQSGKNIVLKRDDNDTDWEIEEEK